MKKGRRITALLLAVAMMLTFAPVTAKAADRANYEVSGIPENVTVYVNGTAVTPTNGKVTVAAGATVLVEPNEGYKIRSFTAYTAFDDPTKARVTLVAPDLWGDGKTGHQLLLDADHTAYGNEIPTSGWLSDTSAYDVCEYKIPENADGDPDTANVIVGGSASLEIPAGTYDYAVIIPISGSGLLVTNYLDAPGSDDDVEFEASHTYIFTAGVYEYSGNYYPGVALDVVNGDAVDLDVLETGGYQFTMPGKAVTIEAEVVEYTYIPNFWDFEYFEDFAYDWGIYDADGDDYDWEWTETTNAHSGTHVMASASYDNETHSALTPDNWLFTPVITVPDKDAELSFWIIGQDPDWCDENMAVYIASADYTSLDDFVQLGRDITASEEYEEYTYDLTDWAGQDVCIAFRHYNVTDMFRLNLDDVWVKGEYDSVAEIHVEVEKMTTEGITLTWDDLGAASYDLYRDGEKLQTVEGTTYTDNVGKTMGTTYEYVVKADEVESKALEVLYNPFADVVEGTASFTHVAWAYNNDVVGGARGSDGLDYFKLDNNCTRAQFCIMLYKMNGLPAVTLPSELPFRDIADQTSNTKKAIIWCKEQGVVGGSTSDNTIFMPKGNIKRSQLAIMLYKMAGTPSVDISDLHFTDISSQTSNTKKAIVWCYQNHLIDSINGNKFSPNAQATRALLTEMLYGYNQLYHLKPDTTVSTVKAVNKITLDKLNVRPVRITAKGAELAIKGIVER